MNICQAGHKKHDKIITDTDIGKLVVYKWEKYKGFAGYCTGQDDISRTLINEGTWGRDESKMIKELLESGNKRNAFFDFGSHIGWFSIMAAQLGYQVMAIEGDEENLNVLSENAMLHNVSNKITLVSAWIDKNSKPMPLLEGEIELLKIDLEGNEQYAINIMKEWLKAKRIKNIFIEISPVFNKSYPNLVKKIIDYGFDAFKDGKPFDGNFDFNQENLLFIRK